MRLIDVDKLKINLYHNKKVVLNDDLVKCIDDTETAYDIDKVVRELERQKSIHTENYNISLYKDYPEIKQRYKQACGVIDKTIEIVKQGGVSDDVCEWKQTPTAKYKTSCGYKIEEYFDTNACYCKQCGKKIKV